jgi:hypothetical protein
MRYAQLVAHNVDWMKKLDKLKEEILDIYEKV